MSMLIRGAKMPSCCMFCPISNATGCGLMNPPVIMTTREMLAGRPDWCPLVEIPAHGRLIDADALATHDNEDFDKSFAKDDATVQWMHLFIQNRIAYAPTIIPAEDTP